MKGNKLLNRILGIDYIIAGISLAALIVVTFVGVIFRYCLNNPLIWEEEIQLALITWAIYFGAAAAFRKGSHIAIDMIVDMFPKKLQKVMDVLIFAVTTYVLFFLMKNGIALVAQFIRTNRTTNILHIPSCYIYIAIPVGCVLMMISNTVYFVRGLLGMEQEGDDEN